MSRSYERFTLPVKMKNRSTGAREIVFWKARCGNGAVHFARSFRVRKARRSDGAAGEPWVGVGDFWIVATRSGVEVRRMSLRTLNAVDVASKALKLAWRAHWDLAFGRDPFYTHGDYAVLDVAATAREREAFAAVAELECCADESEAGETG